jgi:hypothetical protein
MKMFPELEKKSLLGVSEECELVDGKARTAIRFFYHLPISKDAKALYYCYKLKTGPADVRRLVAENLRPCPMLVATTLEELLSANDIENLDRAVEILSDFVELGMHEDSPSSFALYWDVDDQIAFYLLEKKLHALIATAPVTFKKKTNPGVRKLLRDNILKSRSQKKGREFLEVLKMRLGNTGDESIKSDLKLALAFAEEKLDVLLQVLLDSDADSYAVKSALCYLEVSENPEVIKKLREALQKIEDSGRVKLAIAALERASEEHYTQKQRCDLAIAVLLDKKAKKQVRLWALERFGRLSDWEAIKKLVEGIDAVEDKSLLEKVLSELSSWAHWRLTPEKQADFALLVDKKLGDKASKWVRDFLLSNAERKLAQRLYDRSKEEKDKNKKALYESLALDVTRRYQAIERGEISIGTESMVTASLRWLHFHQDRPSGKWDSDAFSKNCDSRQGASCKSAGAAGLDVPITALALLAYNGNGHTHRVGQFKKTVKRALNWLLSQQADSGSFSTSETKAATEKHAFATMAVCEAYGITQDEWLKEPAKKAVSYLLAQQEKSGGWKKGKNAPKANVLTTAWCVFALRAAKYAKIDIPQDSLKKALEFFDSWSFQPKKVKAGFLQVRRLHGIAATVVSSIFCYRSRRHEKLVKLVDILDKNHPKWDDGNGPVYWYFATYSMFQYGGKKWHRWYPALKKALLPTQRMGGCADGSWDPVGPEGKRLGRVGTTAMNALTLEIYYRYARAMLPKPKKAEK